MQKASRLQPLDPKTLFSKTLSKTRITFHQEFLQEKQRLEAQKQAELAKQQQQLEAKKLDIIQYKKANENPLDQPTPTSKQLDLNAIANHKATLQSQKTQRISHLAHLYQQAASFITYENLEKEIDKALLNPRIDLNLQSRLDAHYLKMNRIYENGGVSKREAVLKSILKNKVHL